jgi:transcriptional regulator with XRE-family HTH domain
MRARRMSEEGFWRRKQLEESGDHEAVKRLDLGAYICDRRVGRRLSQGQAAELANITRQEWNRIEKGHHLPRPSNIVPIADAIDVRPAALFERAGYPVPEEFEHYDMSQAQRDLVIALRNSPSLVAFFVEMQLVWQEYQAVQTGSHQRLIMDVTYAKVLDVVLEGFSVPQQLKLARDIVERVSPRVAADHGINNQRFFDLIEKALAESGELVEDEEPPLLGDRSRGTSD